MFRLTDGRDYFYQWDLNRQVIVEDPSVTEVHFCNRTDDCSLVVKVYADPLDSELKADVPNILLQDTYNIRVYAYCDCYTKVEEVFKVKPRTKPSDYVYTETEVLQYSTISKRMDSLEQNIEDEVNKYLENNPIIVDLTGYAKEVYVDNAIQEYDKTITEYVDESISNIPKPDLTGLATEDFVRTEISKIDIPETDLTGYATERWVNNQGYLTSIPSEYVTESELTSKGYAKSSDLSIYAKKTDIPEVPTKVSELENDKGYLTEHQSLAGLATTSYVDNAISNIDIPETDLTGYAKEQWVLDRGYATKTYVDDSIANIDIPETDLTGYATEEYVNNAVEGLNSCKTYFLNTNDLVFDIGWNKSYALAPDNIIEFATKVLAGETANLIIYDIDSSRWLPAEFVIGTDNITVTRTISHSDIGKEVTYQLFRISNLSDYGWCVSKYLESTQYITDKAYVDGAIENAVTAGIDLSEYAKTTYVDSKVETEINGIRDDIGETLDSYYTKTQIDNLFANIAIAEEGSY